MLAFTRLIIALALALTVINATNVKQATRSEVVARANGRLRRQGPGVPGPSGLVYPRCPGDSPAGLTKYAVPANIDGTLSGRNILSASTNRGTCMRLCEASSICQIALWRSTDRTGSSFVQCEGYTRGSDYTVNANVPYQITQRGTTCREFFANNPAVAGNDCCDMSV